MKCAFGNCEQEHDLWIKPDHDSDVVPICRGCGENESEKYHLSFEHSRDPDEVEDYVLAYDPDVALAEQLIDASDQIEQAVTQYEGNPENIEKVNQARELIENTISKL